MRRICFQAYYFRTFKIREFSTGNEAFNWVFYVDRINGNNFADNFIGVLGNDTYIHDKVRYRNENKNIVAVLKLKKQKILEIEINLRIIFCGCLNRFYGESFTEKKIMLLI